MSGVCKLCGKSKKLNQSHIIPSFVGKWLKETSPTGYLRQAVNSNKRVQDIIKIPLLCDECENSFSKLECNFSEKIFLPYVKEELDSWSVAQGKLKEIHYDEWLLKFVISLQWRALVTDESLAVDEDLKKFKRQLSEVETSWREYLLGFRHDSGESRHYVLFLQNLAAGEGTLPVGINPKVNTYLLRSVDTTCAVSKTRLFLYTKMGPIVVVSGIVPPIFKNMSDCLVRMRGTIKTAQHLGNVFVNSFIFITRPNEAMNLVNVSDQQQEKINAEFIKNVSNNKGVNSVLVGYSDYMMGKGKRMRNSQ